MSGNDPATDPVWSSDGTSDVQSFFMNPSWVDVSIRTSTGDQWYKCMSPGILLYDKPGQPNNVWENGVDIYGALQGKSMPPGGAGAPFPADIVEKFRIWYNQGGRVHTGDPYPGPHGTPANPIPAPTPTPPAPFPVPTNPVWNSGGTEEDVQSAFTNPSWILSGGTAAANFWRSKMHQFQYDAITNTMFDLQLYDHVKGWARNIYTHVASQSMPLDPPFFPPGACEMIRLWYNQGCPETKDQVGKMPLPSDPIPAPAQSASGTIKLLPKPFIVRKDINTLTPEELANYRMQVLNLQSSGLSSTWQTGGFLHANWCLHYMQASFPWHRAHLLWLESQIGGPIPYWNFYSSKAADPTSLDSGIPQAFLDDTFTGTDGKVYPNPLRHALARKGSSRASTATQTISEVQRAPELIQGNTTARSNYITTWVPGYLDEIWKAVSNKTLAPQNPNFFVPDFTPLNDLKPNNAAQLYGDGLSDFDGLLEQAHDNLHGWSGPDMSNNSYAAFDPLFWSFHANFDRIFETWVRTNDPQNWGKDFPLRPFKAGSMEPIEGDPTISNYTTIGEMVQDSKILGYSYAPPGNLDYEPPSNFVNLARTPIVLFPGTKCTDKTYYIHVGIDNGKKLEVGEPGYIGNVTRLGMGPDNGNNRCIQNGIVRSLEASKAVADMGGIPEDSKVNLKMLVLQDVPNGPNKEVPESEYSKWTGFTPVVIWGQPAAGIVAH